jgi:hypothetical protein
MKYVKTEIGQKAMHDRSIALSPKQRAAFILLDGKRSTEEVLKATAAMGVTQDDVEHMLRLGLLAEVTGGDPPAQVRVTPPAAASADSPTSDAAGAGSTVSSQERYMRAYPIATRLTSSLGLRGFRLNLAVEAAGSLEQLQDLAPKIRDAVGAEKFEPLGHALYG